MSGEPGVALVPLGSPRGRSAWTIRYGGRSYSVFASGGDFLVSDARCPHQGGPLADGLVRDGVVTCPWHWYSFDLRTGRCTSAAAYRLRTYPVVSQDGRLYAELPRRRRSRFWPQLRRVRSPGR